MQEFMINFSFRLWLFQFLKLYFIIGSLLTAYIIFCSVIAYFSDKDEFIIFVKEMQKDLDECSIKFKSITLMCISLVIICILLWPWAIINALEKE